jgi:tRNA(Ile)-lysidine synthase
LRKWRHVLHADWMRAPLPQHWETHWDGRAPLALPTGDRLALVPAPPQDDAVASGHFDPPLRVGARLGGERIRLPGRAHSHALKHVLQDLDIPPWTRERLPLLCDAAGRLMAAGDLALDGTFAGWLQARGVRLAWERG